MTVVAAPRSVPRDAMIGIVEPPRAHAKPAAWKLILVVGAALVAGYFALPSDAAKDIAYSVLGLASVVAILVAIRVRRPAERLGWYLFAAAGFCFVLGDGIFNFYDLVLHRSPPLPSLADVLYLGGYPLLLTAAIRVSRVRGTPGARESRADAAIVSVGALAMSWQLLMGSYVHNASLGEFGRLVVMAYPVMDIGLLFIVVKALMTRAARRPTDQLIAVALLLMLVSDFAYDLLVLHDGYSTGSLVDAGFLLNYVVMAAAATHPSVTDRRHAVDGADEEAPRRARWLPVVAVAGFVSPAILLINAARGRNVDVGVLASTTIVICALAVLRAVWLFRRLRVQTVALKQRGESLRQALAAQQSLEGDLRYQAFHDGLTGLANRGLLRDRVEHALEASTRLSGSVAVCFCDLDGFKGVNDSFGHQVGDQVLLTAGRRLASIVRRGDTVARLGGDEFAILLENIEDYDAVIGLAGRIVSVLREPVEVDGQEIFLSASVGVAFAGAGTTTESLIIEADAAMYDAKAGGKDRYAVFETVMRSRIVDRMTMMNSFQGSLHRSEFRLEYQPQLRLSDGSLEGFEALARWDHPTLGAVSPYRFIPLAEETGFIVPLGRWVLEHACLEAAAWDNPAGAALTVSVNLSGRQLQDPNIVQDVRNALAFSGLDPARLILEVTESVLMVNREDVAGVLGQFRQIGIRIAIDDFGTGYSSLSYLRHFPVDILKIDKSFVDALGDPSEEGLTFVQTILRLAADLGLDATAEGIERQVQRDILTSLKCHSAQGYLMSEPLDVEATRRYIAGRQDARIIT